MKSLLFLFASLSLAIAQKPNIVVVLCDDLGYGDLACYGHPHIKTPHLDRLAKDGIRFTDFYSAAPVCSPSRVGLLTGRSPNRAGVYDWIPPRRNFHMRAEEVTIPQLLKKAGYATGAIASLLVIRGKGLALNVSELWHRWNIGDIWMFG